VESDSSSSQNDPYVKLKMKPSFFKESLPRGITKKTSKTVDLCLPSYNNSRMNYRNPFYNDPQFIKTVSLVKEEIEDYPGDIIVLAGVSGGGKTSTAFGIFTQNWSIYIDLSSSKGQYGDFMGRELEKIRARPPMCGQIEEQIKVFNMLDLGIISRGLLLIKMLVQEKISMPKEWLFTQLRTNTEKIKKALRDVHDISSLFDYIKECLGVSFLTLIFDEAQVLCAPKYSVRK
jgi:hypothetical protein